MYKKINKILIMITLLAGANIGFADEIGSTVSNPNPASTTSTNTSAPSSPVFTADEIKKLKQLAEKQKLESYTGVPGTSPSHKTVSAAGPAIEETPSGPQAYLFWTQTLSNGFYYEGRIYGKYNMRTQNPAFPDVPPSAENNPNGYKAMVKLGYNFHVTSDYDITPYIRLEAGKNVALVYEDTNGNYIHSTNIAYLAGFKQTFKLTDKLIPYIDIYGGVSQVNLTGQFNEGPNAYQTNTALVNQDQLTTEFGFAFKITEHQSIIPYTQFIYTSNDGDTAASTSIANGGFGISQLTASQQVYALKYSYAW